MLSQRFADAARALVGTPFVEDGRDPAIGVDCAGLIIVALRQCGCDPLDATYAIRGNDLMPLVESCLRSMFDPLDAPQEDWLPGDVLFMRYAGVTNHLGVYLGRSLMLHALQGDRPGRKAHIPPPASGVALTPMDHGLARKVVKVWRLRKES